MSPLACPDVCSLWPLGVIGIVWYVVEVGKRDFLLLDCTHHVSKKYLWLLWVND